MLAPFPTAYLNSLRLSAAKVAAENSAIQQMVVFVLVSIMFSPCIRSSQLTVRVTRSDLLLPVLGRHLIQQLLLLIRLHQCIACVNVIGVGSHPFLCVGDICVHVFKILAVRVTGDRSAGGNATDQLLIVRLKYAGRRECGSARDTSRTA